MAITEVLAAFGLGFRPLSPADARGGEALSAEAGWNQNADDWRHLLGTGLGWGAEDARGRLVATAMVLPYGDRVGWVCMVLVTAAWQRRGIATALLRHCVDQTLARGLIPGLDATAAGRRVYLPLGFQDVYPLTRMMADSPSSLPVPLVPRPMTADDLGPVGPFDRAAFGADRGPLLARLLDRAPDLAWVFETNREVTGFCLGRDGRHADQLGPIVAVDEDTAIALVARALATRKDPRRPIQVDIADRHGGLGSWLTDAGFAPQRTFARMLHGRSDPLDDPARIFAIAGPELG